MSKKLRRTAPPKAAAPASGGGGASARPKRRRGGRVSSQAVTEFTIQLATLVEAGIPVVKALAILEGQTPAGPFKDMLGEVVEDVSGGAPVSEAMAKHHPSFDTLYTSMVRAGEAGGILDAVLLRVAKFREKAAEVRSKVVGAMIYPVIIAVIASVVVSLVIVWVIPKFRDIFDSFGIELPRATQILLAVSSVAINYWYLVFGIPILMIIMHFVMMRPGTGYRRFMHGLILKVPLFGPIAKKSLIASYSRTFGTLIQAGVPHLDALGIVRDATSNEVLAQGVEDVRRTVREGEGLARPMGETGLFDDLVVNMVDVGEQTGELDRMLLRVADAYEVQVDRKIDRLFKVIEPLILVTMAVFVGFIVIALFLPLTAIMSELGSI